MDIDEFDDLKIILWLILFLLFGIVIITCKHDNEDIPMTVSDPEITVSVQKKITKGSNIDPSQSIFTHCNKTLILKTL